MTKSRATEHAELDQFNLEPGEDLTPEALRVRPGNILVMVRNYNTLNNLSAVLNRTETRKQDIVVLHLRFLHGVGEYELSPEQLFSLEEQKLFTRSLELAEKKGKTKLRQELKDHQRKEVVARLRLHLQQIRDKRATVGS